MDLDVFGACQTRQTYEGKPPHRMGAWSADSRTHVATMDAGDFRHNEQSVTAAAAGALDIVLETASGETKVLKAGVAVQEGEIVDATVMEKAALLEFLKKEIQAAKDEDILLSLHMKATMMKVSDPIIFGHAVRVYFADLFETHAAALEAVGFEENNGFGDLIAKLDKLPVEKLRWQVKQLVWSLPRSSFGGLGRTHHATSPRA